MRNNSLYQLVLCRWREFCREPSALFFVIFIPIVWMLIMNVIFPHYKEPVARLGLVVDQSSNYAVMQKIKTMPSLTLFEGRFDQLQRMMKRGQVLAIVEVNGDHLINYHYDANNLEAKLAVQATDHSLQKIFGRKDVITSQHVAIKTSGLRYIDFLIPGVLALSLLTSSLFGTGMSIVANRRENLLKRYLLTPMSPYSYLLSHIIGRFMIMAVEMTAILLAAYWLFDFRISGSWWQLLLVSLLGTSAFTSLAILLGSRLRNTATYNGLINVVLLPAIIFSGAWFSRYIFPSWLFTLSNYFPLTALVDGLRQIMLEGASLVDINFQLIVLGSYLIGGIIIAKKSFRWQ